MNTRVQVEHPVTEIISGIDIIQRMIEIAEGDPLKFLQEEIKFRGYAIEFRINAENPQQNFMPTTGKITNYMTPGGPGVRIDSAAYAGYKLPPNYDSIRITSYNVCYTKLLRFRYCSGYSRSLRRTGKNTCGAGAANTATALCLAYR